MVTTKRLSKITIVLHWFIAFSIIGLLALGWYMTNFELYQYYQIHKSLGVILVAFVLIRVVWRIKKGWPEHASNYPKHEVVLASATHWVLIVSTVLMPIFGMLYSGGSGHGFGIFGLEIFPSNHSLEDPSVVVPLSEFWSDFGHIAHEYNGYILMAAIALHVVGAFKHHIIDKDTTLSRMLGK
ncbi:cytochrome b [Pseudocolwellia agarivorans]|uniref:cytochrome b n=1 Tax=Pseudocolwellia agarivorans TaxID=1911682 RepID=UPI0009877CD3|nr:cytochrome b [Pseudocolwellia agarivorans]